MLARLIRQLPNPGNQRGAVLIIVMVVMVVAIGLALYVSGAAKETLRSAFLLEDKLKAKLEAESKLELLRFVLATTPFKTSRVAPVQSPPGLDLPQSLPLSGEPMELGHSTIRLRDAASMLSVPWCDPALLQRFLFAQGVSREHAVRAADSWRDWLDRDDFKHLNGAERFDYLQRGIRAWTPRNSKAMQAIEESALIEGLQEPELWKRISPELVWTQRGGSNLNTASEPMLQALLDIPPEQAAELVRLRKDKGELSQADLLQVTGKTPGQNGRALSGAPNLTVAVQIRTSVGEARERIDAVLDFKPHDERPVTVLSYEQ